jgi:hypothetical protein
MRRKKRERGLVERVVVESCVELLQEDSRIGTEELNR